MINWNTDQIKYEIVFAAYRFDDYEWFKPMVKVQWGARERHSPTSNLYLRALPHLKCPKDTGEWWEERFKSYKPTVQKTSGHAAG